MELQLPLSFTTLLLISSFIFFLTKAWKNSNSSQKYEKLPPSPPKLPLIGHLHHLVDGLPHQALARVSKRFGPVLHLYLGEVSTVVISSREAAKEVLKVQDPACADKADSIGSKIMWYDYTDIAFSPYNDYWRQMRKICILELLSAKNVKSFGSIRQDEVSVLIKSLQSSSGNVVNLTEKVFSFTSTITCRAAFGKVMKDRDALIAILREALTMAGGFELADLYPSNKLLNILSWNKYKMLRMRRKVDVILDAIVEEHKLKQNGEFGGEDIVDVLVRMARNGELEFPITNDNIKAIIFDIFSGGTDTSSTTIDWAMAELMKSPRVMARVQAEVRQAFKGKETIEESDVQTLKYLKLVIKETFRLHPPAPIILRACRAECKEGETLHLSNQKPSSKECEAYLSRIKALTEEQQSILERGRQEGVENFKHSDLYKEELKQARVGGARDFLRSDIFDDYFCERTVASENDGFQKCLDYGERLGAFAPGFDMSCLVACKGKRLISDPLLPEIEMTVVHFDEFVGINPDDVVPVNQDHEATEQVQGGGQEGI